MPRTPPPNRRLSVTRPVDHKLTTGNVNRILVTFGLDNGRVVELFCADFKAGTDMHSFVVDTSIVLSLLLQHGYRPSAVADKLTGQPHSLLRTLVEAADEIEKEVNK